MFEWLNKPYVSCKSAVTDLPETKILYRAGDWYMVRPEVYHKAAPGVYFGYNPTTYVYIRFDRDVIESLYPRGSDNVPVSYVDIGANGEFEAGSTLLPIYRIDSVYSKTNIDVELIRKLDCLVAKYYIEKEAKRKKEIEDRLNDFNQKLSSALKNTKCGDK